VLVDLLLAVALALLARLAVQVGILPSLGAWRPGMQPDSWIDSQVALAALGLAALRDVPTGASVAKWVLCLRLADARGGRLGWRARLLRAPFSLLPFAWASRAIQGAMPWRVVVVAPSARGLAARTVVASLAAALSIAWGVETVRPSIGRRDAERLAAATVLHDPALRALLGEPLDLRVQHISPRAHEISRGGHGRFELRARGREQQQDMVVLARKIDGAWVVDSVVEIEVTALDGRDPVAAR